MILEKDNASRCARMAKMKLTPAEEEQYGAQLQELFNWVQQLSAVDVSGVELSSAAQAAYLRPDQPVTDPAMAQAIVGAFNDKEGASVKVKKVL